MTTVMDVRKYTKTNRELAADIEQSIGKSQVAIKNILPELPDVIIVTPKQYREFRKAHKIRNGGFGYIYVTRYNVMDVEVAR